MQNLELYEKVRTVPKEAQKTISGGRLNGKTDINPMWRIKTLTEHFGPCGLGWYYVTTANWLEQSGNEIAAFVKIELYVKYGEEWSKPISGTGGSMFVSKEKSGPYVSDECYKMATTDAISVACKQLGIGADVYWQADNTKYNGRDTGNDLPKPSKKQISDIYNELARTGIGKLGLLQKYNIPTLDAMTIDHYNDAIRTLKSKPDKPADPKTIPPENANAELPWEGKGVT